MKKILISITLLFLIALPLASATNYITLKDNFSFRNNAYLTFTSTATYDQGVLYGNSINFTNLVLNTKTSNLSISSTSNIVVSSSDKFGWLNYTSNAGTQSIILDNAPSNILYNNVALLPSFWSFNNKVLTLTVPSSTNVAIYLPPESSGGGGGGGGGGSTPTPTPAASATPTPTSSIIETTPTPTIPIVGPIVSAISDTTGLSPTAIAVVLIIIIAILLAIGSTYVNANNKLKRKMKQQEWKSPLGN
jgi:hypothetical protein